MQWQRVFYREINVDRARFEAGMQTRRDASVGELIQCDDVARDLAKFRHAPFRKRRRSFLDLLQRKITRTAHPKPADRLLAHLQDHDPAGGCLLRHLDRNGLVTLVLVSFFQSGAGLFDVAGSCDPAQEMDRPFLRPHREEDDAHPGPETP